MAKSGIISDSFPSSVQILLMFSLACPYGFSGAPRYCLMPDAAFPTRLPLVPVPSSAAHPAALSSDLLLAWDASAS